MLTVQIDQAEKELLYLDSVFEALSGRRWSGLAGNPGGTQKNRDICAFSGANRRRLPYWGLWNTRTSDGFALLAGRNNRQNDRLTLRQADKNDIWFHTKNIPGSHVILVTGGKEPE